MGYVLDTNIFNRMVDGKFSLESLPAGCELVACHIQIDEINKTSDEDRRARLFLVLAKQRITIASTETFVLDVSRLDNAKLGNGVRYNEIKTALDQLNSMKKNNANDALIGELALANGHVLVTTDRDLAIVMRALGCEVFSPAA